MEGIGKAISLILFVLFLGVALNYMNENHIQIPSIPGTHPVSAQQNAN